MSSTRIITILSAVLVAAGIVAAATYVFTATDLLSGLFPTVPSSGDSQISTEESRLDTAVLERRDYQLLNRQLIQDGSIPVRPPDIVGKANPFL